MKNASLLTKIFLIITLVIVVAGSCIFGIFGFNQDVDYSSSYELNVSLKQNIGEAGSEVKKVTDEYLAEKGISHEAYAFQQGDDGRTHIYKFSADASDKIDVAELEKKVEDAVKEKAVWIDATVHFYKTTPTRFEQNYLAIIAGVVAVLAIFIYEIFIGKLAGAVSVLCSTVISALLYVALVGGTRIPAGDFIGVGIMLASALAGIFTMSIIEKCKQADDNVGNKNVSYFEIAQDATKRSMIRMITVSAIGIIAAILIFALGVNFSIALQLIVSIAVSFFTAYGFAGFTWAIIKNVGGKKKIKAVNVESETAPKKAEE